MQASLAKYHDRMHQRLSLAETFGLAPAGQRLRETLLAMRGDGLTPPSRFGVSRLGISAGPRGPALARDPGGRPAASHLQLFQPHPVPRIGGVVGAQDPGPSRSPRRKPDLRQPQRDRLRRVTGTVVAAAAPARVVRISREFNRGGLKVVLDHGHGLMTVSVHLGRALVRVGDVIARGQPVALSGASGLDFIVSFGLSAPHVHYNVWLDGSRRPVRPAREVSLWRAQRSDALRGAPRRGDPPTRFAPTRCGRGPGRLPRPGAGGAHRGECPLPPAPPS